MLNDLDTYEAAEIDSIYREFLQKCSQFPDVEKFPKIEKTIQDLRDKSKAIADEEAREREAKEQEARQNRLSACLGASENATVNALIYDLTDTTMKDDLSALDEATKLCHEFPSESASVEDAKKRLKELIDQKCQSAYEPFEKIRPRPGFDLSGRLDDLSKWCTTAGRGYLVNRAKTRAETHAANKQKYMEKRRVHGRRPLMWSRGDANPCHAAPSRTKTLHPQGLARGPTPL